MTYPKHFIEVVLPIMRNNALEKHPIVKVEHYRLKQDSVKYPVELKEDPTPYRAGGRA